MRPIKILFNAWADHDNTNFQSLNARDIAVRLDPQRFASAFFALGEPKPELENQPQIKIIRIPRRLGSLVMAAHMAWGSYDLIYYPPIGRQRKLLKLFKIIGRKIRVVFPLEATAQQLLAVEPALRNDILNVLFTSDIRFAIGQNIAKTMETEFGLKMPVIPVGIDTKTFSFIDRRNHTFPINILYLGTIQQRKQVHLIMDLAKQINPAITNFHIIGYPLGDHSYYDSLLKRKADEGLDHVFFHGKMIHSKIPHNLKNYDILVLPSRLEGVPKVTLEAAASGMPCVIFDDYQSPSVIDGITGFQVNTFEQMVERVRLLVDDQQLRWEMGTRAAEHVKKYDWGTVIKLLEDYFNTLVMSE